MRRALAVIAAVVLLTLGGCASGGTGAGGSVSTISVTFADGKVTPKGDTADVAVGREVTFVVTSDVDEELHVHGEPELLIEVKAGMQAEEFTYTPQVPGRIGVETHGSGVTVVTLVASN